MPFLGSLIERRLNLVKFVDECLEARLTPSADSSGRPSARKSAFVLPVHRHDVVSRNCHDTLLFHMGRPIGPTWNETS